MLLNNIVVMSLNNNVYELKDKIMSVIKDNEYNLEDLKDVFGPIYDHIDTPNFKPRLNQIVEEIIRDRDGDGKFNIDDLDLLTDDILAVTCLINGVLLVITSIPELKFKYESGKTEELLFQLFAYIFLIVIPKETNRPWTIREKEKVVNIVLSIYLVGESSQVTKDLVAKIEKWFIKKGFCKCISTQPDNEEVFQERIPQVKAQIRSVVQKEKNNAKLRKEINDLRNELKAVKSAPEIKVQKD